MRWPIGGRACTRRRRPAPPDRDFGRPAALSTGVRPLALAVVLWLLAAAAARADVRIDGHGFGHGVGLSQYGAFGYARDEGRDFRFILAHYYPGTTVSAGRGCACACGSRSPPRCASPRPPWPEAAGATVRLRPARTYRSRRGAASSCG